VRKEQQKATATLAERLWCAVAADDRRLRALDEFIAGYEAEYGEITEDEMAEAARRARERAVVVRGNPGGAHGRGAA
jgi:hypothetical protein